MRQSSLSDSSLLSLSSAYVGGAHAHQVTFQNDAQGQVLSRTESGNVGGRDPKQLYYYFNGLRVGDNGNNGTDQVDYATSIQRHAAQQGSGPFLGGGTYATGYADFDEAYDPINSASRNNVGAASVYTVKAGDSLQSVAAAVWGDSGLWYVLAEANGLNASSSLSAGQVLSIPAKVSNAKNASSTFKVYDPNKAIGDNQPTTPN
jgi:LysM repeat protein